jgi:AraC-like DNA-binding protein
MHHDTALDLSFAPLFRSFYHGDVKGYGTALDSLAYPGELRAEGENPRLQLQACRLVGGGLAARVQATAIEVRHRAPPVDSRDGEVLALFVVEGRGWMEQDGSRFSFGRGDLLFRTTARPSTISLEGNSHVLALKLTSSRLFGIYSDLIDRFEPARAGADQPLTRTVQEHLHRVLPHEPGLESMSAYFCEQSLVSLLAAVYCETAGVRCDIASGGPAQRWDRLVAFIDASLGDADLSVDLIARELRISKRYTHRLFEARGLKYGDYVREKRLQRARDELRSERLRHLSVTDIGLRNGFSDSSHFSRSFRKAYGLPPAGWRRQAA